MNGSVSIDGRTVEINGEKNLLELVRKTGIDLPTFCYHSELSVYGGCRMCIVEDQTGRILASCSTPPKDGMVIYTSTQRLRKYRRMNLELILSNHDRDCTVCEKNGKCKLQELATRFGIKRARFVSKLKRLPVDRSSPGIVRNPNKCIMCGDCVRMCKEVQGLGILQLDPKDGKIKAGTDCGNLLGQSGCVSCGQCAAVCPTGGLIIRNDTERVWNALQESNKRVVAQIAPAVRVGIGEEFGMEPGENTLGKVAAALRKLDFDAVYDICFAADLTAMEESGELLERLDDGQKLPLFTSCCPAWVKYAEDRYPELLPNISHCLSPQQMLGKVIKGHYGRLKDDTRETVVVSIVPCTAKKMEAVRPENSTNGKRDVDIVITTQELAAMIREAGIVFEELGEEALDAPFGLASGAGILFGVTGGVTEAVLRRCSGKGGTGGAIELSNSEVRGRGGIKELSAELKGKAVRAAVVHGLKNADELVGKILKGEKSYDFVEVMACPGGCIGGAGQPIPGSSAIKKRRTDGICREDRISPIRISDENPAAAQCFDTLSKTGCDILHRDKRQRIKPLNDNPLHFEN